MVTRVEHFPARTRYWSWFPLFRRQPDSILFPDHTTTAHHNFPESGYRLRPFFHITPLHNVPSMSRPTNHRRRGWPRTPAGQSVQVEKSGVPSSGGTGCPGSSPGKPVRVPGIVRPATIRRWRAWCRRPSCRLRPDSPGVEFALRWTQGPFQQGVPACCGWQLRRQ